MGCVDYEFGRWIVWITGSGVGLDEYGLGKWTSWIMDWKNAFRAGSLLLVHEFPITARPTRPDQQGPDQQGLGQGRPGQQLKGLAQDPRHKDYLQGRAST